MLRMIVLSAAFALATLLAAMPASAYSSRCVQPYAPTVPDGRTATKPQIDSAKNFVVQFIKDSDQYQDCLLLELKTERETAARKGKTFNPQIQTDITNMVAANQREKERVGAEYNGQSHIYNEAHPKTQ